MMQTKWASAAVIAMMLALSCAVGAQTTQGSTEGVSTGWAKVIELKGEVQVQLPQQSVIPASREMILPAGSSIQTKKGSALLRLEDGSEVLVKGNSSVVLKSPQTDEHQYLQLLLGKLRAAVKKRTQGAPSFKLGTPTAVITVRGTQFEVSVGKNLSTEVLVYEGLVEVAGSSGVGPPALLGPGYYINVPRTGVPSQPRRSIQEDDRAQRGNGRDDDFGRPSRSGDTGDARQSSSRTSSGGEHESPDN